MRAKVNRMEEIDLGGIEWIQSFDLGEIYESIKKESTRVLFGI